MFKNLFSVIVLACLPVQSFAADAATQKIIDRCKDSVGKYGASIVKVCVDDDIAASKRLLKLRKQHGEIVSSCQGRVGKFGPAIVESCAKEDIAAEEALSNY